MKAHTLDGTLVTCPAKRSMISFTENESVTSNFGNNVFKATSPPKDAIKQILVDGTESEVFIFHMIKAVKK